jgi:hypothetical protein
VSTQTLVNNDELMIDDPFDVDWWLRMCGAALLIIAALVAAAYLARSAPKVACTLLTCIYTLCMSR